MLQDPRAELELRAIGAHSVLPFWRRHPEGGGVSPAGPWQPQADSGWQEVESHPPSLGAWNGWGVGWASGKTQDAQ